MADYYILEGKEAVAVGHDRFYEWFSSAERTVALTKTPNGTISTVFLGINHEHEGGDPLIFETKIFGGTHDDKIWQCSTWEQAEDQHQKAIELTAT